MPRCIRALGEEKQHAARWSGALFLLRVEWCDGGALADGRPLAPFRRSRARTRWAVERPGQPAKPPNQRAVPVSRKGAIANLSISVPFA